MAVAGDIAYPFALLLSKHLQEPHEDLLAVIFTNPNDLAGIVVEHDCDVVLPLLDGCFINGNADEVIKTSVRVLVLLESLLDSADGSSNGLPVDFEIFRKCRLAYLLS